MRGVLRLFWLLLFVQLINESSSSSLSVVLLFAGFFRNDFLFGEIYEEIVHLLLYY